MIQLSEIKSIKIEYKNTDVYDLEIESAHQYIANNFVVHNCTTGVKTGIHASMDWLLRGISHIKKTIRISPSGNSLPKIIADGGLNTVDRIIKCYALGADYVMCGKLFAQCEEACGETREHVINTVKTSQFVVYGAEKITEFVKERRYYGMASNQGQIDISGGISKAEEGTEIYVPVKYTLSSLHSLISSSLRSAMSYTGAKNLNEFRTNTQTEVMSIAERNAYYK